MTGRPRVLFVGRSRYSLPLPGWLAKKWDAVEEQLDYRILGAGEEGSPLQSERFRLTAAARPRRLDGVLFHVRLPLRVRHQLREFRPDVMVAADPFVGVAVLAGRSLARSRTPVIVEVHGDWRTFTRLYGSPSRRTIAQVADALARLSLRRADATRALSRFTSSLVEEVRGRPADGIFPTYSDLSAFTARPVAELPQRPTALFVGALEAYKNVDGLAAAWRRVAAELPEAKLMIVGKGSRPAPVERLVRDLPDHVEHVPQLDPDGVARAFDESTLLVLPSWPEGLGRVVIEVVRPRPRCGRDGRRRDPGPGHRREGRAFDPAGGRGRARRIAATRPSRPGAGGTVRRRRSPTLRRVALDTGRLCGRVSRARRAHDLLMRLVFITQTLDADHPVLGHTLILVEALAARTEEVVVVCGSVGRHALPANVRIRSFGVSVPNRARARVHPGAQRRGRAPAAGRRHLAHGAALPDPGRTDRQAAPRAAPPLVHALEQQPLAADRDSAGRCRAQRRRTFIPASVTEGARNRARDRWSPLCACGQTGRGRRSTAAARARTLRTGQGLPDDPRGAEAGAGTRRRREPGDPGSRAHPSRDRPSGGA